MSNCHTVHPQCLGQLVSLPQAPPVNYLVKYTNPDKEHSHSTWYALSKCEGSKTQSECKAVDIM